jgi:hypothetical protein
LEINSNLGDVKIRLDWIVEIMRVHETLGENSVGKQAFVTYHLLYLRWALAFFALGKQGLLALLKRDVEDSVGSEVPVIVKDDSG